MGSFSFGSQQFWKIIITILHNSYQECCAQNPALGGAGHGGGNCFLLSGKVSGYKIGTSWGKLLVLCLRESLNSSHSSAQSGDWNENFPGICRSSTVNRLGSYVWICRRDRLGNNPDLSQSKGAYLEPGLWLCYPLYPKGNVRTGFLGFNNMCLCMCIVPICISGKCFLCFCGEKLTFI